MRGRRTTDRYRVTWKTSSGATCDAETLRAASCISRARRASTICWSRSPAKIADSAPVAREDEWRRKPRTGGRGGARRAHTAICTVVPLRALGAGADEARGAQVRSDEHPVLRALARSHAQALAVHYRAAGKRAVYTDTKTLHAGAVSFVHRYGSTLSSHVHFHVAATGGVYATRHEKKGTKGANSEHLGAKLYHGTRTWDPSEQGVRRGALGLLGDCVASRILIECVFAR